MISLFNRKIKRDGRCFGGGADMKFGSSAGNVPDGDCSAVELYDLPGNAKPQSKMRLDRKSTRLNSSHIQKSRMPSSA